MAEYIDPMQPLIEEIMSDFRIQHDDNVIRACADVGIRVDKPRLMQALTDASVFYAEGYKAAMNRAGCVVEVVRCKDCRHNVANWQHDELDETDYTDITCDYFMTDGMCPNDFCSYGAKMDGKGEENG